MGIYHCATWYIRLKIVFWIGPKVTQNWCLNERLTATELVSFTKELQYVQRRFFTSRCVRPQLSYSGKYLVLIVD